MSRLLYVFALAFALSACGGETIVLRMQPVASADVRVTPTELIVKGKKLWIKLIVQNMTDGVIMIQRDQMVAHLPNGQTLARAMGTYGGVGWGYGYAYAGGYEGIHAPYVLPPGAMHPVYVEYEQQGFKWEDVPSVQIDFAGAITRDGKPLPVPPFVLSR
jgi:hypothetical protein